LFLHILESFGAHDLYLLQKQDALRNIGLSSIQKCTKIALEILTYRITPDAIDELPNERKYKIGNNEMFSEGY